MTPLGSVLQQISRVMMHPAVAGAPSAWATDLPTAQSVVSRSDVVGCGLVALAAVSMGGAVFRARSGRAMRPFVLPACAALALAVAWIFLAEQIASDTRSSVAVPSDGGGTAHDHGDEVEDSTVLISSAALAEHLLHLREVDLMISDEQQQESTLLLQSTRQAADRYREFASAKSEGYVDLTDSRAEPEIVYLYDREFVREGTWIDPGRPQALVYLRRPSAAHLLVGTAFIVPAGDGPRIGGGLTIWFPHRGLCVDSQDEVVAKGIPGGGCPSGSRALAPQLEALHVWLFENPNGSFAGRLTREAAEVARRRAERNG